MFQSRPLPANAFATWVREQGGRRTLGLGLAIFIEALLLLLLLTLGPGALPGVEKGRPTVVTFIAPETSEDEAEQQRRPEPQQQQQQRTEPRPTPQQPQPEQPPQPAETPPAPASPIAPPVQPMVPSNWSLTPSAPRPPAAPTTPTYGPVNRPTVMQSDTERVGTAPNGEPMYAAEWYRRPEEAMMRSYLSSAHGPGWAMMACRTASEFRVEDCVPLQEYPTGSQIMRSVLAMAWELRVRPPRRGGQVLVGSWVRIRITYD